MSRLERRQQSFLFRASAPLLLEKITPPKSKRCAKTIQALQLYHDTHLFLPPLFSLPLRSEEYNHTIIAGSQVYFAALQLGLNQLRIIPFSTELRTPSLYQRLFLYTYPYLMPLEKAHIFQTLLSNGYTQQQLAAELQIGRSSISHQINLLKLSKEGQEALAKGLITVSHAKELCSISSEQMTPLVHRLIKEQLTVSELRVLIEQIRLQEPILVLSRQLKQALSQELKIKNTHPEGKATLSISFDSIEALKSFVEPFLNTKAEHLR